ncbi:MAG: hypothetical protein ACI86M_003189 [Saprospiraceae bacterium]|jgi:hypothetical protein
MNKHIFLLIVFVIAISSCCKEDEKMINPYFAKVYPQILDSIELECDPDTSYNYVFAEINNTDFCRYESKVGKFELNKSSKFMTSSPTIGSGEVDPDARQGASLDLGDIHLKNRHEVLQIKFPDFKLGRNFIEYLDSIFSIEEHDIIGLEDIVIPDGTDIEEEALLKFSGGYLKSFLIELGAVDRVNITESGGNGFSLRSIYGDQEDSYIRFTNVEKTKDDEHVYYDLEIDFSCNLYHWPQYGYEGLWGEVRNGKIIAKVSVDK